MTECERFVKEGLFTLDFFREEIRCDFLVTVQRKRIWAVEIAALLKLDAVCRHHGLRYFLAFGGLLGAVRHRGYIPWDDDIDVLMPRCDYEKLLLLGDEFPAPYFLQTPYTDPGAVFSTIRLRNSNTTWMVKEFAAEKINFGLGVDIFPLDFWRMKGMDAEEKKIRDLIFDCSTFLRRNFPNKSPTTETRVTEYLERRGVGNGLNDWEQIQTIAKGVSMEDADCLACLCVSPYAYDRQKWALEDFSMAVFLPFEGFNFPVPVGYSDLLRVTYGEEYMQFPPLEKRGEWHQKILFDPDRPYVDYLKEIKK